MNKQSSILIFFALLLMSTGVVVAQPKGFLTMSNNSSFIDSFTKKSASIFTNEADFVQEKSISVMTEKLISKGKFYYKKENLMRWEILTPTPSCMVLKEGKISIQEKGKIKTVDSKSNKIIKNLNEIMLSSGSGSMLTSKEYEYILYENATQVFVQLIPLSSVTKKHITKIELLIEKSDYTVSQLKLIEPSGDYLKMDFTNKKLNQPIPLERFTLP